MNSIIIFLALYLYLFIIILGFLSFFFLTAAKRKDMLKLSLLTFPFSFLLGKLLSFLFYNPRPFVLEHIHPLIPHAPDNGFPSDHALLTMTIAAVVVTYNRKLGIFLFCLALAIGIARILANVHHLIDILGSICIAAVTTYLSWLILRKAKAIL